MEEEWEGGVVTFTREWTESTFLRILLVEIAIPCPLMEK